MVSAWELGHHVCECHTLDMVRQKYDPSSHPPTQVHAEATRPDLTAGPHLAAPSLLSLAAVPRSSVGNRRSQPAVIDGVVLINIFPALGVLRNTAGEGEGRRCEYIVAVTASGADGRAQENG